MQTPNSPPTKMPRLDDPIEDLKKKFLAQEMIVLMHDSAIVDSWIPLVSDATRGLFTETSGQIKKYRDYILVLQCAQTEPAIREAWKQCDQFRDIVAVHLSQLKKHLDAEKPRQ